MKKILFVLLVALAIASCKKEYRVEIYRNDGTASRIVPARVRESVIKARNDSVAYGEAYEKFMAYVNMQMWNPNPYRTEVFYPEKHFFSLYYKDEVIPQYTIADSKRRSIWIAFSSQELNNHIKNAKEADLQLWRKLGYYFIESEKHK